MEDITLSIDLLLKAGSVLVAIGGILYTVRDHHAKIKDNSSQIQKMDLHITNINEDLSRKISSIENNMGIMRLSIERMEEIFQKITEIKVKKSK